MSLIECYHMANRVALRIKRDVDQALGRDSADNDKHRVLVTFHGCKNSQWAPMRFEIQASHGYYGSSSGYSNSSPELGTFLAIAIEEHHVALLDRAAALATEAAETARQLATDEAREVLSATAGEPEGRT